MQARGVRLDLPPRALREHGGWGASEREGAAGFRLQHADGGRGACGGALGRGGRAELLVGAEDGCYRFGSHAAAE